MKARWIMPAKFLAVSSWRLNTRRHSFNQPISRSTMLRSRYAWRSNLEAARGAGGVTGDKEFAVRPAPDGRRAGPAPNCLGRLNPISTSLAGFLLTEAESGVILSVRSLGAFPSKNTGLSGLERLVRMVNGTNHMPIRRAGKPLSFPLSPKPSPPKPLMLARLESNVLSVPHGCAGSRRRSAVASARRGCRPAHQRHWRAGWSRR